jgi:SpoVK/Ycf46/Vps4 family AAA+-type ATPase
MGEKDKNTQNIKTNSEVLVLVEKKIEFYKEVIQKTILHVQKNKNLDILGISDVSNCIEKFAEISNKIQEISDLNNTTDVLISKLQIINDELSSLLKHYGTAHLEDLLLICFGNNNKIIVPETITNKFELLKKYFHPVSYKVVSKKEESKGCKECVNETNNFSCYDISSSYKQLNMKVYGIKLYIRSTILNKSLVIFGIVDDIILDFLYNKFITLKNEKIYQELPKDNNFQKELFDKFMSSLILKDYFILENSQDFYSKYIGYMSQNNILIKKHMAQTVKDFISDDIYAKRNTLITLLICSYNYENQYLAYLLYDLLSNEANGQVDTQEQTILFDSFPYKFKQVFKVAMKKTIQYTNEITKFDINKIPLEQQICLMKVPDSVKEKAMIKLKEIKTKSDETCSKARQYLDGLLKIPFNIYRKEPILTIMNKIKLKFKGICDNHNIAQQFPEIMNKDNFTNMEIINYIKKIKSPKTNTEELEKIKNFLITGDKKKLINNIGLQNKLLSKYNYEVKPENKYLTMTKPQLKKEITQFIDLCKVPTNSEILKDTIHSFQIWSNMIFQLNETNLTNDIDDINNSINQITNYMKNVKTTFDKSVYGHEHAKNQIEKIIAQWINGHQDGYCFGFEGPPGVGKTSLAKKGLSDCLKDDAGISRPFAMIQMGGDSNGSTIHGHNYTYVGSTWGSIVQILIDKKCMNPIIFIDEVDKISRTEHGKEIVGILTHLLDSTQNECFQDKYFNSIDLDLSKALFILSYNDPEAIDRVLLDRIHRIKFNSLSIQDKIIICNTHILPEVYKKVGLENMIEINEDVIKFITEEYTCESGVRKLKEIMFEIVGEINVNILKNVETLSCEDLPIKITIDDIKNKYLKERKEMKSHTIHKESQVGVINALWANQYSQGGVLPLQANFVPSNKFLDLVLTGSMGDVMRESISVSLTNAWNLTSLERRQYLIEKYNDTKTNNVCGLHIHCPDISTKKDGPSATTAFTVLIYSLFNDIKIKNYFGITGETNFSYQLTEIGGLQEKILFSIKAGIKEFIYPQENQKDFDKIMKKYKDDDIIKGIKFHSINHISDVFDLILEKE